MLKIFKYIREYETLNNAYIQLEKQVSKYQNDINEYQTTIEALGNRCSELETELSHTIKSNRALKSYNNKYKEQLKRIK